MEINVRECVKILLRKDKISLEAICSGKQERQ